MYHAIESRRRSSSSISHLPASPLTEVGCTGTVYRSISTAAGMRSDKQFFEKRFMAEVAAEIDDVLAGLEAIPDHALHPYRFVAHTGLV